MKTRQPLILTARISDRDLEPFDILRQAHFPPERNFLSAHLTMFHRLPGEYEARIVDKLKRTAQNADVMTVEVSNVKHLGAGVAYNITGPELVDIRTTLKAEFVSWIGPQDRQKWQPHITVQNKVSRTKADDLYCNLVQTFHPHTIDITGLDLWEYLGGPWRHTTYVPFNAAA